MRYDREVRGYLAFLACFCLGLFVLAGAAGWMQTQGVKTALAGRERTLTSAMLAEGLSEDTAARILVSTETTEAGKLLLSKIGRTAETSAWLLPLARGEAVSFFGAAFCAAVVCAAVLLTGSLLFLHRRDALYREGWKAVEGFAEGNFTGHMPRAEAGTLYGLFGAADRLAKALQAKSEEEQKSRQALQRAVSDISHQLKIPLAALTMYMEIIQQEARNPEAVQEFTEKSMQSLERMERLIQSLLKMMRLDAGSIVFAPRRCPAARLVWGAAEEFTERAKKEGKRLVVEGEEGEELLCDPDWTEQALSNLVKNALEHTSSGGTVRLTWRRAPGLVRICVEDDGCGIAPEDLHHIFKRFYRSRNSSDKQGAGVGLPLAKAIVEEQGGIIDVESTVGKGTVFYLVFPA